MKRRFLTFDRGDSAKHSDGLRPVEIEFPRCLPIGVTAFPWGEIRSISWLWKASLLQNGGDTSWFHKGALFSGSDVGLKSYIMLNLDL